MNRRVLFACLLGAPVLATIAVKTWANPTFGYAWYQPAPTTFQNALESCPYGARLQTLPADRQHAKRERCARDADGYVLFEHPVAG